MGQKLGGKQSAFVYWLKNLRRAKESHAPVLLRWIALIYEVYLVQYVQFTRKFRIIHDSRGKVQRIFYLPPITFYNRRGKKVSDNKFSEDLFKMYKRQFEDYLFNHQTFPPDQRIFLYNAEILDMLNRKGK